MELEKCGDMLQNDANAFPPSMGICASEIILTWLRNAEIQTGASRKRMSAPIPGQAPSKQSSRRFTFLRVTTSIPLSSGPGCKRTKITSTFLRVCCRRGIWEPAENRDGASRGNPQLDGCTHTAPAPHMTELSSSIASAATNPISTARQAR